MFSRVWPLSHSKEKWEGEVNVLYAHICRFTSTYTHNNKDRHNDKDERRKTSLTKYIPLTLLQGFERVVQGLRVRGSRRPSITEIFRPQTYGRQRCVFLVLQGCSTGGPEPTLLGDGFLYCVFSVSSLDPNSSGPKWPFRPDVAFPTTSRLQLSATQLASNSTVLTSVLTELYNSSTPTRSLKSHVWSSSSGNNCHAVQRPLSSGASLCSGIVGPSPCPILSALIHPRDLFRLLSITRSLSNVSLPSGASPWNSIFGPGRMSKYHKRLCYFFLLYRRCRKYMH